MLSERELREKLLKLLREDEEFRYAVAGAVGLAEILSELRDLRARMLEQSRRLEAIEKKLLEHDKRFEVIEKKLLEYDKRFEAIERKLLEHDKRFEAIERKLLEHDKRLEAIERKLLEHDKRFEAIERKLLEHDKRLELIEKKLLEHDKRCEIIERKLLEHDKRFEALERKLLEHDRKFEAIAEELKRLWTSVLELNRRVSRVEDSLGALSESVYAKFILDMIMYELAGRGERLVRWERNARVDGEDIDLLVVGESSVYVVEVKVKPRPRDVGALLVKAEIVAKHYPGKSVHPILTGTRIGGEVVETAASKGVRVVAW